MESKKHIFGGTNATLNGESIVFFNSTNKTRQFFAIGRVRKIERGDKLDMVYVNLGLNNRLRAISVINNHARRQLLTLKVGQFALFYGEARRYRIPSKDGKFYYKKWVFFPYMIQGMYVPNMMDVRKHEQELIENNEVEPTMSEETKEMYEGIINGIFERED